MTNGTDIVKVITVSNWLAVMKLRVLVVVKESEGPWRPFRESHPRVRNPTAPSVEVYINCKIGHVEQSEWRHTIIASQYSTYHMLSVKVVVFLAWQFVSVATLREIQLYSI